MQGQELQYIESAPTIEMQLTKILDRTMDYLVIDIEQYVDKAEELATKIESIKRAKNCDVIIYAPGYDRRSRIIMELVSRGIRYYIFSADQSGAREELERCLNGYYIDMETTAEEQEEEGEVSEAQRHPGKKIGVAGVCRRIGTTTAAVQIIKYLQLKGYKACYIEVNDTGFVQEHGKVFVSVHDEFLGRVTYENVDMYYRQEILQEVLKQDYDYFVFDYGAYSEQGFNKTSFLEKDIRIFVAGSKASEMKFTVDVIRNEYYTDVVYLFNFISEKEKTDLLEYMEDKAEITFFTVYSPDQFEFIYNMDLEKMIPVEDISEPKEEKRSLFGWRKKKKNG